MNQTAGSDQAADAPRHASASRRRSWTDLAVLSQGFRPFFLLAGIWAILALIFWIHAFVGMIELPTRFDALTWHSHEMLFGYAAAVLAGFLLTAIPNWTGRLPLQGGPLAALVLFWIIGRLAVGFSAALPPLPVALLDLSFLTVLLLFVLREIIAGKNWRNLPLPAVLAVLILANALVHAGQAGAGRVCRDDHPDRGACRAELHPQLAGKGENHDPPRALRTVRQTRTSCWGHRPARLDAGPGVSSGWISLPARRCDPCPSPRALAGSPHLAGAALAGPACGLWLDSTALAPAYLPASVGIHALTAGAIATMTLAVMTRAIRGHTGRELTSDLFNTLVFVVITFAALTRLVAPYLADHYMTALMVSATL
jgi:uncharacterized protein involved in response to NO